MRDTQKQLSNDVLAVGRIGAVPPLLEVLCDMTGLGFAVVARVTVGEWTACAVHDRIDFGVTTGERIDVYTTLCCEVRATGEPIFFDHASADSRYRDHPTPKMYGFESYVSVPIVLGNGEHFGNLCALGREPLPVSQPRILAMFGHFARVIAERLDLDRQQQLARDSSRERLAEDAARETFVTLLEHDLKKPLTAALENALALEKLTGDPESLAAVEGIRTNLSALSTSVDDMMDFANGRLGISICGHFEDCARLEGLFADVVRDALVAHPKRTLISHVTVRRTVRCDPARLQQLVANLVEHALSQGPQPGPASLIVNVESDELVIEVWNDGDPLPADSLEKMFTPFRRSAGLSEPDGVGLRLHVCELIVKAHRGTLVVTSSKAMGTQVVARIPLLAG